MTKTIQILIDKDLKDLIPGFMENRKKDIETMKFALSEEDFEQVRMIGHRMKGFGSGYGFEFITDLGKQLEEAAKEGDKLKIEGGITALINYLDQIEICFE
ncbi:Hpt domain-containing protein [Alkalihalobacterium chitinilyticum]|uniref:Hpt domain-containing protein n=1 Tax=Alkalihalobacterium chitinilyticum TaxID=2980103 RepID=A0ABT5V8N3_9BACI|nr:Hpt domain-containing protein [Alkalihalobacterium chitinilyticum]MDE5411800.1 Hpt domain-containing protein [Alkalihalobacterium chitinilyticum]